MIQRALTLAAFVLAAAIAMPALAVTFGPLEKSGTTASDRKGFYLSLANPYERAFEFTVAVDPQYEDIAHRVRILPARTWLTGGAKRRILVIAEDLERGEQLEFRVCAERVRNKRETVHARVCSRLTARRADL